jgi:hypothetical protein
MAPATVAATSTATARVASPTTMTASTAMTAAAAVADKFHHRSCTVAAFFVEDVERCQANVGDFFFTKEDSIAISVT